MEWITPLFNIIFRTAKMSGKWQLSKLIPLYKNKRDVQECNNYRDIKLLSHTMKMWERIIEIRLRKLLSVSENQFGFISGRLTIEVIHLLRRLI